MLRIEHCRYFLAISELGSISKAAVKLNISQPHLSQCLRQLEAIIGAKLVNRSPKGVQLTNKGHECIKHCGIIMQEIDALKSLCDYKAIRNSLKVATFYASAPIDSYFEVLQHVESQDHILLEVINRNVIQLVLEGRVQLGILYLEDQILQNFMRIFKRHGLSWLQLTHGPVDIAMSYKHPLSQKEYLTIEDIRPYALVFDQSNHINRLSGHLSLLQEEDQKVYVDKSIEFLKKLTVQEMGFDNLRSLMYYLTKNTNAIAFAQKRYNLNDPLTKNGEVQYIPLLHEDLKLVTGVIYPKFLEFNALEKVFIKTLRKQIDIIS